MLSPLAASIREDLLTAYHARGTRVFVLEQFTSERGISEQEALAAFEELEGEELVEVQGRILCPEGHVLWVGPRQKAEEHQQARCDHCDPCSEPLDPQDNENRIFYRVNLNKPLLREPTELSEKVRTLRERLRAKFAEAKKEVVPPNPTPRYDDVFFEGVAWLDSLAGPPLVRGNPSVHDVVAFLLERRGPLPHVRLQVLLYYCQGWSLAWDRRPLFSEPIEAWWGRPTIVTVYETYAAEFQVDKALKGDPSALDNTQQVNALAVFDRYKAYGTQQLHDLVRSEDPWRNARRGLGDTKKGPVISLDALRATYYVEVSGGGGGGGGGAEDE